MPESHFEPLDLDPYGKLFGEDGAMRLTRITVVALITAWIAIADRTSLGEEFPSIAPNVDSFLTDLIRQVEPPRVPGDANAPKTECKDAKPKTPADLLNQILTERTAETLRLVRAMKQAHEASDYQTLAALAPLCVREYEKVYGKDSTQYRQVAQRAESFQRIAQLSPNAQQQVRSADIAMSLGEKARSAGAYAEAAEKFRHARETYRQHLGAGEFNSAKAAIFLATTVGSSGNFAEAVQILREAEEDFTGTPVEGTDLFPALLEHEGDISMKQKAYERAEDCFRRGSQAWQMVAGANSPEYLQCRYKLVGALHLLERRADAERLCRETIDHAESSKSKRDVATKLAYLYSSLAKLCQEQGNDSGAVEAFSAILPASESTWRNQSAMLKQMYEAYAQSLERLERAEEAKAARAKAEVCGRDANLASEFPIPASSPEESGCATQQD